MPVILKNRVRDTTSTTGTGDLLLSSSSQLSIAGANNTQTMANFLPPFTGDNFVDVYYLVISQNEVDWEIGRGRAIDNSNIRTLIRDEVFSSSNSGNKVSFASGNKAVFLVNPAVLHAPGVEPADKQIIITDLDAQRKRHLHISSLEQGYIGDATFSQYIGSTFSLLQTGVLVNGEGQYRGGVLAPNGEIHFVPGVASRGQKMNYLTGEVSTYSLIYTTQATAYAGGVLAPNGDIHFVPYAAVVGQKVSLSGIVSTYALVYSATSQKYVGGVLAPNGVIHFTPFASSTVFPRLGQAVNTLTGIAHTYSLIDSAALTSGNFAGGVLTPNGKVYFIPRSHSRGQILDVATGTFSTYSLPTGATILAYTGGVLARNGDIHFVPFRASRGQKINYLTGAVATYSLVLTGDRMYSGGVLAPNGDIHFVPLDASRGQKVNSITGAVSTYSLVFTTAGGAYSGGVLAPNGDIIFINQRATSGTRLSTLSGNPLPSNFVLGPYLNKF